MDMSPLGSSPISVTYQLCEEVPAASRGSAPTFPACKMVITVPEPSPLVGAIGLRVFGGQNVARPTVRRRTCELGRP